MKNYFGILSYTQSISYQLGIGENLDAFILKSNSRIMFWKNKMGLRKWFEKNRNFIWINNPQAKFDIEALNSYNNIFLNNISIFITGCNSSLVPFLKKNKFEIMKTGKEAILNLDYAHFRNKSLKEIIRIGFKHGNIIEIPYSDQIRDKLEEFKSECTHGNEPQLKYLYNDILLPSNRLFVFESENGAWLGAITVRIMDKEKVITDLILRSKMATKGTMEALIYSIFGKIKQEGFISWSLGEVPYIIYDSPKLTKEYLINFTGRRLKFAYNYLGLYNFKNKFEPEWQEVYTCGKPKLNLTTFVKAASFSNMTTLVRSKFFYNLYSSGKAFRNNEIKRKPVNSDYTKVS